MQAAGGHDLHQPADGDLAVVGYNGGLVGVVGGMHLGSSEGLVAVVIGDNRGKEGTYFSKQLLMVRSTTLDQYYDPDSLNRI